MRAAACARAPALLAVPEAHQRRTAVVHMQQQLDDQAKSFYEGYVETDPVTGESKALTLDEKEKLYLECLDAYYNEDGKQLLGNEEYEQLKLDLDFDGSRVATFSADEIRFILANKRFKMNKPILSDSEYDTLRKKLKDLGSPVVIHEGAKCNLEDGICKNDMSVDNGKTRLLYLPGTIGASLLLSEIFFWTLHIDPLLSLILGAVPSYFAGVAFTENVFAQKPLVVQAACPSCGVVNTVFFGDLFNVRTDGLAGPADPNYASSPEVELKCPNPACKEDMVCNRETMIISSAIPKV